MGGYGLSRKFVWIQMVKKVEFNGNENTSTHQIDGPIDWNTFGSNYEKTSNIIKIQIFINNENYFLYVTHPHIRTCWIYDIFI